MSRLEDAGTFEQHSGVLTTELLHLQIYWVATIFLPCPDIWNVSDIFLLCLQTALEEKTRECGELPTPLLTV
jgi:hypothetical protein